MMTPENESQYGDAFCRGLIERMYQEMLPLAWSGQRIRATALIQGLDDRLASTKASITPAADALEFETRFTKMRGVITDVMESETDRAAFIASLGLTRLDPVVPPRRTSNSMPLGELAVRTAVRATVWDSVRLFFRMFR
jgi:hypothetical protein